MSSVIPKSVLKLPSESVAANADNTSQPSLAPLPSQLPSLANKLCIIGQGQRADVVFSRSEFLAICEHMLNGNSLGHFMTAWQDAETGRACFAKAKRGRADKQVGWAWDAITAKAKVKTSLGFYPSNQDQKTRWGAMDFDAHDGDHERARRLSLAAFQLLLSHPQLYLVLCTSGGSGFHLFVFTRELYPIADWIVLLKQVRQWIGAMADGVCDIFPNEKAESQRVGKGIRAPGTVNPKTGNCSLIETETIKPLLRSLPRTWTGGIGKVDHWLPRETRELSLHKRTSIYSPSTDGLVEKTIREHPILGKGMRNGVLMKLIGDISHKFGREKAREIVERHYQTYSDNINTPIAEHLKQFDEAWPGQVENIRRRFTAAEKNIFDSLRTDHQREGFRIAWAFAGTAEKKDERVFPIVRASLADRLTVTEAGASEIIRALVKAGAIRQVRGYQRHVRSAQYEWICGDQLE